MMDASRVPGVRIYAAYRPPIVATSSFRPSQSRLEMLSAVVDRLVSVFRPASSGEPAGVPRLAAIALLAIASWVLVALAFMAGAWILGLISG